MRSLSFVSTLLSLGALTLSMLCLFAGNKPGFLDSASILTITISPAGKELLLNATLNGGNGISSELSSFASEVGISDWYAIHVMNYCRGSYANATSEATTSCSASVPFFSFDPIQIISESSASGGFNVSLGGLNADLDLSASGWPTQITNAFGKAQTAYKVVFFLLCLGIASSGVEGIVSLIVLVMDRGRLTHGTTISMINLGFGTIGISFFALGLASGIITGTMVVFVKTINDQNEAYGLGAGLGTTFLWLTWAATISMLVTACIWVLDYSMEKRSLQIAMYGLGPLDGADAAKYNLKQEEKMLKAEEKVYRKKSKAEISLLKTIPQAAMHSPGLLSPVVRSPGLVRSTSRGIARLPGEILRHEAVHAVGNIPIQYSPTHIPIQYSPTQYSPTQYNTAHYSPAHYRPSFDTPDYLHSRPQVIQRDFI